MSNLIVPETVYRGLEERIRDLEAQLQAAQTQIATVRRQAPSPDDLCPLPAPPKETT